MAPQYSSRLVHFGVFELDLETGELRKGGAKIKLQGQPFQILAMLLEHPGEIVTREQLRERLWRLDTFVDFDHGLNTGIKKIRQALGDDADSPRFIETLPRKGYRFIAPVNGLVTPALAPAPARRPALLWAAVALSVIIAAGAAGWILSNRLSTPEAEPVPVPLTSYPGIERAPSFSPDGNEVAFSWRAPGQTGADIYVKLIGTDPPVRLTTNGAIDPAWSPDGRLIAFHRAVSNDKCGVFLIPAIGGSERKVTEIASTYWGVVTISPGTRAEGGSWCRTVTRFQDPTRCFLFPWIPERSGS